MDSSVIDHETRRFGRLLHYAGLAIVLVCGAMGYSWLYTPVESNIFEAVMKIEELTLSGQNSAVIRNEHARLSSQLQDIEARYAALEERVPVNAEAGNFLKHISEIAREEKLVISNFQPAQSTTASGFSVMEVMLDGKGEFESLCSFFDRLSKLQRLSKVKDLAVVADPKVDDEYPMKATILIYFGLQEGDAQAAQREVSHG